MISTHMVTSQKINTCIIKITCIDITVRKLLETVVIKEQYTLDIIGVFFTIVETIDELKPNKRANSSQHIVRRLKCVECL